MSKWSERITSHSIWEEMKALGTVLDIVAAKEITETTTFEDIERIRSILTYCGKRLASTDPFLLQPSVLDTFSSLFTLVRSELDALINDNNTNHFITANLRLDELLVQLRNIPTPTNDDLTFISESITSYRNTLDKNLKDLLEDQKALRTALKQNTQLLDTQEKALSVEQQKISVLTTEFQSIFSTTQDKRASDFSLALAELQAKVISSINENQTQFSNTQIANSEKVAGIVAEYTNEFDARLAVLGNMQKTAEQHYEKDLARLKTNYEKGAKSILNEITEHKKQVEALVGVIGNLGVTSGYLKTANHARLMLYVWQFLTITALSGLIVVAYKMAFPPTFLVAIDKAAAIATNHAINSDSVFYQGLAVRVFLSITFGVFAAYAAKQADKQQKIESKNRKLALELEALGAFISPLPIEMQHKFRAELGERSFGMPDSDINKFSENDPVSIIDLLKSKEFEELASRFIKFVKSNTH